ncbi:permease [Natronospora cellulosivora (SeqCode)]
MKKFLMKNKLLVVVLLVYIGLFIFQTDKALESLNSSRYYIVEMLKIMPIIFILASLINVWVPKEVIVKYFGKDSGAKGVFFSFLLGSFSEGPIYAAFPVCKSLMNKGASIPNIVIIISSWAVIKVPMLINEAKFLGGRFMFTRWITTVIAIMLMSYIIRFFVSKKDIPELDKNKESVKNTVAIKKEYCIGCAACVRVAPENFVLKDGKAEIINKEFTKDLIKKSIENCPLTAIY